MSEDRRKVPILKNSVAKESSEFKCLVENCNRDLSKAKKYYQRHNVCEEHLKASQILVDGELQRFCQQCGKFQPLQKFDKDKRSCRDSLRKHKQNRDEKQARKTNSGGSVDSEVGTGIPPVEQKQGLKRRPSTATLDSHPEEKVSAKRPYLPQHNPSSNQNLTAPMDIQPLEQFHPFPRQASEPILPQLSSAIPPHLMHPHSINSMFNFRKASQENQQRQNQQEKPLPRQSFLQNRISNLWDRSATMDMVQRIINNEKMNIVFSSANDDANFNISVANKKKNNNNNNIFGGTSFFERLNEDGHSSQLYGENLKKQMFGLKSKETKDLNELDDLEDLPAGCCFHPGDFDSNGLLDLRKIQISDQVQLYQSLQDRPDYCYIRNNDLNV